MIQADAPNTAIRSIEALSGSNGTFVYLAQWVLGAIGADKDSENVATLAMIAISSLLALAIFWLSKFILLHVVHRVVKKTPTDWDDYVFNGKLLHRMAFLPTIAGLVSFGLAMETSNWLHTVYMKVVYVYAAVCVGRFVTALIRSVFALMMAKNHKARSLRSIQQLLCYVVYLLMAIVVVAVIIDRDPTTIIAGLGASAALMSLIFKETIASLVSGIQLSANDMLEPGDWIEVPKAGANGVVEELNLNTVKVRNWDNTITTIPPSTLMQDSFINWQDMKESNGRRFTRQVCINMDSVRFLSDDEELQYAQMPELADFLQRQIKTHHGRITNLAVFRQYMQLYLMANDDLLSPGSGKNILVMVRYLQPSQYGLPVEVYCFTKTTVWTEYERVVADVVDFMVASLPLFGLRPYQVSASSGR